MTLDLEARIRTALREEAERAPLDAPEWTGRDQTKASPSRRPWLAAASVAVIVAGAVGLATIARDGSGTGGSTPFEPEGDEFPLRSIDPASVERLASYFDTDLVRPGSVVVVTAGGISAFAYDGVLLSGAGDRVRESRCISELQSGSDWCVAGGDIPEFTPVRFEVSGRPWLFSWVNVPSGAAFVELHTDGRVQWQRPIGSIAMFLYEPSPFGAVPSDAVVTAYADDGEVIARFDSAMLRAMWDDYWAAHPPEGDNLSAADNRRVQIAGEGAMRSCLGDAGIADPLAPTTPDEEQEWDRCIGESQSAAMATFEELGGELVASLTDDPSHVGPEPTQPS